VSGGGVEFWWMVMRGRLVGRREGRCCHCKHSEQKVKIAISYEQEDFWMKIIQFRSDVVVERNEEGLLRQIF
jgi:hypothetical protein